MGLELISLLPLIAIFALGVVGILVIGYIIEHYHL